MSFSSAHADRLDPDSYMRLEESGAMADHIGRLEKALKPYDSGRWDYDGIQVCITGKDADLETCGQQGFVSAPPQASLSGPVVKQQLSVSRKHR